MVEVIPEAHKIAYIKAFVSKFHAQVNGFLSKSPVFI
jgi:hypothetical protein